MLFWRIAAILLVLSAINEPLDLQTLLTSIGRAGAHQAGWYGERRVVQYVFVLTLAGAGLMAALAMLRLTIGADPSLKLAWAGLVTIGLFGFLRV